MSQEEFFTIIDIPNKTIIPEPSGQYSRLRWIEWGMGDKRNLFWEDMISIYNERGMLHKGIIDRKVQFISGAGIEMNENNSTQFKYFVQNTQDDDDMNKIVAKIALDYELTNSYAIGVIWGSGKNPKPAHIYHIPIESIRFDREYFKTPAGEMKYFWICNDWTDIVKNPPIRMQAFKKDGSGEKEQIYLYQCEGKHSKTKYTIPYYYSALNWVVADYSISLYHNNQIQNDFSPGYHLYIATGNKTQDQMAELYRSLERKLTGPTGKKIFVTYGSGQEQKTTIDKLEMAQTDKRYLDLDRLITENIYRAHQVVNRQLFGDKAVGGSLAGVATLQEDLQTYQKMYIDFRQRDIEYTLNLLAGLMGVVEPVKLKRFTLLND